ncbi:alpha-ribazole phosphatase [Desulfuromonas carbonis]|uniref:alpha-ribazole phosphatase n=1 Tax=Desulfuromonas sp. DDH964 TaxID=1823759 RepID=UPI00078BF767|nr:alpha-ribazole phosphatase [Desulfuromonas sp. DDH964]AMV73411.1 adenosylcobalamin-5'-phosphate phosphatase [Desulfuromonas sp. DDH964]
MTRTRIYLVRHGQVVGHEEKRYNGQGDVPLTPRGEAQFGMLQLRLAGKPIKAVYCSDLQRTLLGARVLAQPFALQPAALADLRELHIGAWEGMTWQELKSRYPQQWQARLDDVVHYRVPGGENLIDLAGRVLPAIRGIVARHQGEEVVVVAHGGVNRVILLDAIGAPLQSLFSVEQDYGCLNIIDYFADGNSVVRLLNG